MFAPVSVVNVPVGQAVHAVDPAVPLYVPSVQRAHVVAASDSANEPTLHLVQLEAEVAPTVVLYFPAGQAVH